MITKDGLLSCVRSGNDYPTKSTPAGPSFSGLSLEEIESRSVWEALERHHCRRLATARELGIDKNTLRRKIKRYGLEPPKR